mgnify:CR=1 FL=1
MQGLRWIQMSEDERDAFLGRGGTGVIAFARGSEEPPFQVPVSYGYDGGLGNFYFKLAVPPDSPKAEVVDEPVSFTAHARTDEGYRSVVATGTLEAVAEMPSDSLAAQGMWAVDIPAVDIFERPREEVPFEDFRLAPARIAGRKEVQSEP